MRKIIPKVLSLYLKFHSIFYFRLLPSPFSLSLSLFLSPSVSKNLLLLIFLSIAFFFNPLALPKSVRQRSAWIFSDIIKSYAHMNT